MAPQRGPMTPEEEIVYMVARYSNMTPQQVKQLPYKEFLKWVHMMNKYPSVETIVDIHLSRIEQSLGGGLLAEHLIAVPDRKAAIETEKQAKLRASLNNFGSN